MIVEEVNRIDCLIRYYSLLMDQWHECDGKLVVCRVGFRNRVRHLIGLFLGESFELEHGVRRKGKTTEIQ